MFEVNNSVYTVNLYLRSCGCRLFCTS